MHIVIAGGGIAGLAAAVALGSRGHRITLVECGEYFAETGAGIQVGPNAVHALAALGMLENLLPVAVRPQRLFVRSGAAGRLTASSELGAAIEARFGAPWLTLLRSDLHRALLAAARGLPAISLKTGCGADSYAEHGAAVEVSLGDGTRVTCDALLGADGLHSTIRACMLADGPPVDSGLIVYRALVPTIAVPPWAREANIHLWLLPGRHVVHYPVAAGSRVNIVAMAAGSAAGDGWGAPVPGIDVAAGFADAAADLAALLAVPDTWLRWAALDRPPVARWRIGRVGLIGDAAHPVLPCLAQGAAMALEDAVVLARLMPPEAANPLAAFCAFESERRPRVIRLYRQSRRQARIYHLGGALAVVRDAAMATVLGGDRLLAPTAWLQSWRPEDLPGGNHHAQKAKGCGHLNLTD